MWVKYLNFVVPGQGETTQQHVLNLLLLAGPNQLAGADLIALLEFLEEQ